MCKDTPQLLNVCRLNLTPLLFNRENSQNFILGTVESMYAYAVKYVRRGAVSSTSYKVGYRLVELSTILVGHQWRKCCGSEQKLTGGESPATVRTAHPNE
ncbi:hypothetical protein TRVL_01077 [Trypanosoma vivax]|nr:hypothetical protein TRVL_01077 [Trypanosoma vivax]